MTERLLLSVVLALAAAACGSGAAPAADAAPTDGVVGDAPLPGDGTVTDVASAADAPRDAATDGGQGDGPGTDATGADAAFGDASSGDAAGVRPAGQCVVDGDCGGSLTCTVSAPGGICAGCGGTCPLGLAYECYAASCVRGCAVDDDCPAGLRCAAATRCALIACSATDAGTGCPDPFTCQGGFCRRPLCSGGCPGGWICRGTYCTER
jgi:hypothetical protein